MNVSQQHAPLGEILLIGVERPGLEILSTILTRHGYEVRGTLDESTALDLVAARPPALILLDTATPGLDSYTVCKRLKADPQTHNIPVLFISAADAPIPQAEMFAAGGADYITRPYQAEEVLARVRTHLAVHILQKQLDAQHAQQQQEIAIRRRVEAVLQKANAGLEQESAEHAAALEAEIAGRARAEAALEDYIRFETLLADLAATFVNLTAANADAVIAEGLHHVRDCMALDRCMLIEFSDDNAELCVTYAEANRAIEPVRQDYIPAGQVPWLVRQLQRGEVLRMRDLPAEAAQERAYCRQTELKSGVAIPLAACSTALGALVCGTPHREHAWPDELMSRLRVIGELFANALVCKRMESQIRMHTQHLETLVATKVRELELARAKMIQTAKLASLGEMATGVAHELNQPLTAMLFEAEYLKTMAQRGMHTGERAGFLSSNELYHIGESLVQDIERSRRITDYLRAFSDIAKGNTVKTNINRAIEGSFTLTEARLGQRAIVIERDLSPNLPAIHANPHKLEQVFANLISNAEYALEEMDRRVAAGEVHRDGYRKMLTIATYVEDDHVVAQVRDNGCGIPKTAQPHIFEPFFTTKPVGEGSGLGLSICQGFVAEDGGQITFESQENHGTTFTLRFPPAAPET